MQSQTEQTFDRNYEAIMLLLEELRRQTQEEAIQRKKEANS